MSQYWPARDASWLVGFRPNKLVRIRFRLESSPFLADWPLLIRFVFSTTSASSSLNALTRLLGSFSAFAFAFMWFSDVMSLENACGGVNNFQVMRRIFFRGIPEHGDEAIFRGFSEYFQIRSCLKGMEKAPQKKNSANMVDTSMAYRYRRAHELEFVKQTDDVKQRILAAKQNPDKSDRQVGAFVKSVIGIAESDREL